jgi:hypothetical protein
MSAALAMASVVPPPVLWQPTRPAIIRPAEHTLLRPGAFRPVTADERRAILADLVRTRRLTPDEAARALFFVPVAARSFRPVTFTWTANVSTTTGSSSVTFSSVAIGTASSTRLVIVCVGMRGNAGAGRTVSGCTIAGTAATQIVASASNANPTAIYTLVVATGTTASIVVTGSGTLSRAGIGVATLDGYASSAAVGTNATVSTSATSVSLGVNASSGGVVLWTNARDAVASATWSGATADDDETPGVSYQQSSAHLLVGSSGTSTASVSWSGSANASICGASWR